MHSGRAPIDLAQQIGENGRGRHEIGHRRDDTVGQATSTTAVDAILSSPISESPKGTLSLSTAKVRPGSPVDFTVDLQQPTVSYWLLDYNVKSVELYRRAEGETTFTPWKFMDLIATNRASYRWTPEVADAGTYEFAALVETKIEVLLLEVQKDSVRPLEVSCFAAPASARPDGRMRLQQAAGQGARVQPQATTCADVWAGTSTYIGKTPGLPTANITSHATVTFTYDPTQSFPGALSYKASGIPAAPTTPRRRATGASAGHERGGRGQRRWYCVAPNRTSRSLSVLRGLRSPASTSTPRCTAGRAAMRSNQSFRRG